MVLSEDVGVFVEGLLNNKVIAVPTETVFGLSCRVDTIAIEQILSLKGRSISKGFIILGGKWSHISPYIDESKVSESFFNTRNSSDSAITWVVPASSRAPQIITGGRNKIAVRLTRNKLLQQLCNGLNECIITTSANKAGESPALSFAEVQLAFPSGVKFIYKSDIGCRHAPTKIIDIITGEVIRK
jgi:L-threonylcarbamoyladenylate synthase